MRFVGCKIAREWLVATIGPKKLQSEERDFPCLSSVRDYEVDSISERTMIRMNLKGLQLWKAEAWRVLASAVDHKKVRFACVGAQVHRKHVPQIG